MAPKIVVGVDDTSRSAPLLAWTTDFAVAAGAEVLVLHAVPRVGVWVAAALQVDSDAQLREIRATMRAKIGEPLRAGGVVADCRVVVGDPAHVLMTAAQDNNADLIVVGAPHQRAPHHLAPHDAVVGSTLRELERSSDRPIVVIPHGLDPRVLRADAARDQMHAASG